MPAVSIVPNILVLAIFGLIGNFGSLCLKETPVAPHEHRQLFDEKLLQLSRRLKGFEYILTNLEIIGLRLP